jgi:cytochrome c-type biogenesis protein CcsB
VAGTWTPNAATQGLRRLVGADPLRIPDPTRGFTSLAARLAPAKTLDRVEYRLVAFAFPVWTFAVIAGAVWAESAWGRYWGWDPKETWSFVTWLVYAAYLHARTTAGWRKWASTISLVAFSCLMANYFLINLVFVGMHSYGGVKAAGSGADVCQTSSVGDGCRTMRV